MKIRNFEYFVYRRKGNVLITDVRFVCSYDELFDRK